MENLILALLVWIGVTSNAPEVQYNGQALPTIRYADHAFMVELARGKKADPKDYNLQGVYDHIENTIWLRVGVEVETNRGKAVLVHELVHYLQNVNGALAKAPCIAANERLAYDLDGAYRRSHGVPIPWNEITVLARSQCLPPM